MEGLNWNKKLELGTEIANPLITAYGANTAKKFEASQINRNAKAISAKGNREAYETRRQGKVLASNARAAMAGSGGLTSDAGAVEDLAKIKRTTDYNALSALFESETQAENLKMKAKARTLEGRQGNIGGLRKSLSTVLSNSDKIFGK